MSKNIVAFDVETTGLSFKDDYIIQLSAVKIDRNFNEIGVFNHYIMPYAKSWNITDEAFGKHGLTKEFIAENGEYLADVGLEFLAFIDGCDLLSYNGKGFDVKMLLKDLRNVGLNLDIKKVFYDSFLLEAKLNPRTLDAVYKRYTGKELDNSHNALFDVYATIEVFKHQLQQFDSQNITLDDIMNFDESKIFCVDNIITKVDDKIIFAIGKYKGHEFMEVASTDASYIKWIMTNDDFDITTKQTLREYYAKNR
jgi:DNA polymerase III epsilon subunit-like protein